MSVLLETNVGEMVVDLFVDECPRACTNFLKLCKLKYYNDNLFFNVQENFMVQCGDPTATGKGGNSVFGLLYGDQARFFEDEIRTSLKHDKKGLLGMANSGPNTNASQFYITTRAEDLEYLDGKHTIFGEIAEGMDVLERINEAFVDDQNRPLQDFRIKHTYILEDPFDDPKLLQVPDASPVRERPEEEQVMPRVGAHEKLDDQEGRTEQEIEQSLREKEAKSRAVVLEMIGDLPDADVKPPEEVLFVCKLNPVTESDDLDVAFSRFGPCKSEVIRDYKTGDSLCYAFVEFTDKAHCEEAYFKMNNVLLDDRRIKVDFSQSVSKLWNRVRRGEKPGYHADRGSGAGRSQGKGRGAHGGRGGRGDRGGGSRANGSDSLQLKPQFAPLGARSHGDYALVGADEGSSRNDKWRGRRSRSSDRHEQPRGRRGEGRDRSRERDREQEHRHERRHRRDAAEDGSRSRRRSSPKKRSRSRSSSRSSSEDNQKSSRHRRHERHERRESDSLRRRSRSRSRDSGRDRESRRR